MLNLTPRHRDGMKAGTHAPGHHRPAAHDEEDQATSIVGIAHVILGAVGLTAAGVGLLFSAQTPLLVAVLIARVVFELATCYAGLLIKDGQRKGAFIALGTGALRTVLLLVSADVGLMLVISVVLIGASGWLLSTLGRAEDEHSGG